ncbi:MAG: hypothetical protein DRP68_04865 [Candidatus Omnitrophota bacterium]|nr:MAG: hypothetical protein DRP68_04865 [Candidatus Omnitrophota bacterium]RKY38461.1 MAG: hypothetical protein DRP72_01705 [Candidatus Omnitrophota bacterium]
MKGKEEILHRVVTFLNRKELDFLDNISKDILFSLGIKVPRSTLLKNLVDIFLEPKLEGMKSYDDLLNLLIKKSKEGK